MNFSTQIETRNKGIIQQSVARECPMILRMNRKINNTASFLPETSIASYVYIPSVKIPLSTIKLVEMKNLGNIFGYLRS